MFAFENAALLLCGGWMGRCAVSSCMSPPFWLEWHPDLWNSFTLDSELLILFPCLKQKEATSILINSIRKIYCLWCWRVSVKATEIQCPRSCLCIQRTHSTLMNTPSPHTQAETWSKCWASLGVQLWCCWVTGNSKHCFLLSVGEPEAQMQTDETQSFMACGLHVQKFLMICHVLWDF